jgi:cytochrome P450
MVFLDLLQAGTDTTSTFLETLMLYMVLYPDVQDGVWKEIQSVIIPNGEPSHDDIQRMPYTQATLLESLRMGKVSVNLVPRRALKDIHYKGYLIPKVKLENLTFHG